MAVARNVTERESALRSWQSPVPEAVKEMVVDAPRLFRVKAPNSKENALPAPLNNSPPGDILRNFYHTKRVGNYLIGRKLGEGSFAKVREGLHALTGEKVR